MNWLSDEEIDTLEEYRFRAAFQQSDIDTVFAQAKDRNRLQEDLKSTAAAFYGAKNELDRLRERIKSLQEWLRDSAEYYNEKAELTIPQEESNSWSGRADACEDFIDDLAKLLEDE